MSALDFNLLYAGLVWAAVAVAAALLGRLSPARSAGCCGRSARTRSWPPSPASARCGSRCRRLRSGAAVLGLAGALYAHFNAYVAPDAFQPLVTVYIVLALTAGGTGRMAGAVLGAVLVVALQEGTRFGADLLPGMAPVQVAALRAGAIGAALILVLHLRPNGLLPETSRRYGDRT